MSESGIGSSTSSSGSSSSSSSQSSSSSSDSSSSSSSSSNETTTESIASSNTTEENLSGESSSSNPSNNTESNSNEASDTNSTDNTDDSNDTSSTNATSNTDTTTDPNTDTDNDIDEDAIARSAADTTIDAVGDAAKAAVGYNAGMYGEIGIGSAQVNVANEARFGSLTPGSNLASPSAMQRGQTVMDGNVEARVNNYSIDEFSQHHPTTGAPTAEGYRGNFARNTMVSSQATFNYGETVAANEGLARADVEFEVARPGQNRTVDVHRPGPVDGSVIDTEIKAATGVNGSAARGTGQLGLDVRAANQSNVSRAVEYVFTDNVNTGAHGPTQTAVNNLDRANALTGGNLTHSYVPDIAPGRAAVTAVETASNVSRGARALGRVAAPLGIAADAYSIGSAYQQDGGQVGKNTAAAVAGSAGGWVGGAAGAWGGVQAGAALGSFGGPVGAAVGGVVGGIVGGVLGGFGLSWGAETATRAALD